MRFDYSQELEDYRAEVRAFIERHGPGPRRHVGVRAPDREQVSALRAWVARLYAAGYLGQTWPVEYGGRPGATVEHTFIVAEEIARARTWGEVGAGALAAGAVLAFGSEQQRLRYLPRIRSGADLWCQLFSEPGAGSDLASLKTRAVRDRDHYVVNGQKVWTTNGQHADLGYLLARTNPDVAKQAGITAFALDMRTPGVDVRPLREITGTSDFNEVFLDDVRIPADQVIGEVGAAGGSPTQAWATNAAESAHAPWSSAPSSTTLWNSPAAAPWPGARPSRTAPPGSGSASSPPSRTSPT